MNAKFLFLVGMAIGAISFSSYAANDRVLTCVDARTIMDAGYQVEIVRQEDSTALPPRTLLLAKVSEQSLIGPRLLATFEVLCRQAPVFGAPLEYLGSGFELHILMDASPIRGMAPSHLEVASSGFQLSQDMLCRNGN